MKILTLAAVTLLLGSVRLYAQFDCTYVSVSGGGTGADANCMLAGMGSTFSSTVSGSVYCGYKPDGALDGRSDAVITDTKTLTATANGTCGASGLPYGLFPDCPPTYTMTASGNTGTLTANNMVFALVYCAVASSQSVSATCGSVTCATPTPPGGCPGVPCPSIKSVTTPLDSAAAKGAAVAAVAEAVFTPIATRTSSAAPQHVLMTVARATPRLEVDLEVEVTAEAVVRIHAIGHATKTSVEPTVIMAARSGAMTTVPARTKKILLLLI